jgi:putative restriction endonuclease
MDRLLGWVANTDYDWYWCLRDLKETPDEVNFWQPSGGRSFHPIEVGAPFFFRLKQPHYAIAGFGLFASFQPAPAWLAWRSFGVKNGANTYAELVRRIARYNPKLAGVPIERAGSAEIGCIMVAQPVFFPEGDWIAEPRDWARNIVQSKSTLSPAGKAHASLTSACGVLSGRDPSPPPRIARDMGHPYSCCPDSAKASSG